MPKYRKLKFTIKDFTPYTLPMARLAEYLADYAVLLGNDPAVHFRGVEDGSAELVSLIEEPELPIVRQRAINAAKGHGPEDAVQAYRNMNAKLKQDKTSGRLQGDRGATLLQFPGIATVEPATFGPFNQQGTLDGILIKIGGKDKTIPVHLEDGPRVHICNATSKDMARRLAPYLYG
jgi:hypothetical protein